MSLQKKFIQWIGSTSSLWAHTIFFVGIFALRFFGFAFDDILLILTTVVSLEAIYLAIFIQMTVNQNTSALEEVEEDIDEIQTDIDEIQADVDEIEKETEEIHHDIEEAAKEEDMDLEKIQQTLLALVEEVNKLKQK